MKAAGTLKLIGCTTETRTKSFLWTTFLILAIPLSLVISCGRAKIAAQDAVKRAESTGELLNETNAPDKMTLSYRLHLQQAQLAMKRKKYALAREEAEQAAGLAENILQQRKALKENVKKRLDRLWSYIEHEPVPRESVVVACFNAREAYEEKRYEKADGFLSDAERQLRLAVGIGRGKMVYIQGTVKYFDKYKFIPIYKSLGEEGLEGDIVAKFKEGRKVKFIRSVWITPNSRYVNISFNYRGAKIAGWVDGRFVH